MAKTIQIDESRCNGCGLCVEACHEGALALVDGKAKLVRPNFCDGMGDCLPACPQDAISFVEDSAGQTMPISPGSGNVPMIDHPNMMAVPGVQWPIQLALVSPMADFLKGTLVVAADCTAFKVENFQKKFVDNKPMVIGCTKLDERAKFDKLVELFRNRSIDKVEVIRMEVPCCSAMTRTVKAAIEMSGKDILVSETIVSRAGEIIS
ncbi:MAG: 4Fe-4S binding protein [Candidatus Methanomethylophilaceae archaeon]|nr:4Fe-4S binding protein [Candidatus Methanomethylophilaceae archaeon]